MWGMISGSYRGYWKQWLVLPFIGKAHTGCVLWDELLRNPSRAQSLDTQVSRYCQRGRDKDFFSMAQV